MEEDRTAVCQGWGSILLGAEVHSPNSWWVTTFAGDLVDYRSPLLMWYLLYMDQ